MERGGASVTRATAYAFEALDATGRRERGSVDAASPDAALRILGDRGLLAFSLREAATARQRKRRLPAHDLALGLRVLANLLAAGLPLTRALQMLTDLAPPSWNAAIPAIATAVREGSSLASAFSQAPVEIPPLVIGIAFAGEAGAGLGAAMQRAAEHSESVAATRAAIRGALAYPLTIAFAGAASLLLMLGVVLPRFARILADLGQTLPTSTRIVLRVGELARLGFVPGILVLAATALLARTWASMPSGRRAMHALLLDVPGVGAVRMASGTANALSSLSSLLESGVGMRAALNVAAGATGDAALADRILRARDEVIAGTSLGRALSDNRAVTTTAARLVRAGEDSGRLADMMRHASQVEREHAERLTKGAVRVLEPALILSFAGVIGFVAAALLQAVYAVRPT